MTTYIPKEHLTVFLFEAKLKAYAVQGNETSVAPLLPGSRQAEYRSGDLLYRDIHFGFLHFIGQETVYRGVAPIWSMGYAGEILSPEMPRAEAQDIFGFLQKALRHIHPDRPYRGPTIYRGNDFIYTDQTHGHFSSFWGVEEIARCGVLVYQLRYHGGTLR
jgi:hypothetical protein